ncbi:MAG TPA: peptidoglycan editing factor PgeF [Mycobacteriales bacterium]|nr:peptidoglycan editing factor PgeF [Mycobacteriales bacterium]
MAGIDLIDAGFAAGLVGGFTTRAGGHSPPPWDALNLALHVEDEPARVLANRERLTRRIGSAPISFPQQVHGPGVLAVDRATAAEPGITREGAPGVDALVTGVPGVPLGVLVADCLPVLLADRDHGVVAAAHAGRRGLAEGVLQATLATMAELGATPATTIAVIGPAICGRCYEVPAELREQVAAVVPGSACQTRAGTPGLDLPAGAERLLRAAGVSQVSLTGHCTAEDGRFYSYRRDGLTGRFAGFVMIEPDA